MVLTIGRTKTRRRRDVSGINKKNRGQMKGGDNPAESGEVHVTKVTRYVIDLFNFGEYL